MSSGTHARRVALACAALVWMCSGADAQSLEVRGFADIGVMTFTASNSFDAMFGSSSGLVFGGGGGVVLPQNIFVTARASRIHEEGQRVFVNNGEVFDLGIATTVTITPFELTGGYRFGRARDRARLYAGGGISWYRYTETDEFSTGSDDDVNDTFSGLHLLGGVEARAGTYLAIAGEVQWTSVPDALGQTPTSVGTGFDETNLGGFTFRAKVVVGR